MSIFGHPIGECDWCGTDGLPLFRYNGKDVCAACRDILKDYDNASSIKEEYRRLRKVLDKTEKYYS